MSERSEIHSARVRKCTGSSEMVLYTDSASDSESASSPASLDPSSAVDAGRGAASGALSSLARRGSSCDAVAGSAGAGEGAEALTGGHTNAQSLRTFSVRYLLTASFCLALSLLTRSASISEGGGTAWGKECRILLRGDLGDLYRSEKIMIEGTVWSRGAPRMASRDAAGEDGLI